MTPPDAVVTRAHREDAARAFCLEATGDSMSFRRCAEWIDARERGVDLRLGRIITGKLDAMAQSLANLEAAVRREYSELQHLAASAARMLRDGDERDVSGRIFKELETLKNG